MSITKKRSIEICAIGVCFCKKKVIFAHFPHFHFQCCLGVQTTSLFPKTQFRQGLSTRERRCYLKKASFEGLKITAMAQQRLLKLDEIESATHNFFWKASNELVAKTPAISKHVAGRLVRSVPEDGMSAFAGRMHCTGCGALMQTASVRVRKMKKRCKDRNRVLRRCPSCDRVNRTEGVLREVQVRADGEKDIERLRREQAREGKQKEVVGNKKKDLSIAKTPVQKSNSKKKRRRSKSLGRDTTEDTRNKRTGLAASFLFEPL